MLNDLNPAQLEAATESGNCLVLAGPGSGKTKMLASKAAKLLSDGKKVVAVTFTKDSAMEIRHRIIKTAGNKFADNLLVGTFHGLCYMILSPPKKQVYGKNILAGLKGLSAGKLDIAGEGDRRSYVQRAVDIAMVHDIELDVATSLIEEAKSLAALDKPMKDDQKKLFLAYQEVLLRNYKIDFQDLITETVKGLRNKSLLPFNTDVMLVDESQDIDQLQYEWIAQHARAGVVTTIVGDDDQSVYSFRQAMGYVGMEKFANEFSAKRVILNVNYRCKEEVLASASVLVKNNIGRLAKNLIAHKGKGGSIEYRSFVARRTNYDGDSDKNSECKDVAETLGDLVADNSCAVIGRTNSVLDDVEEAMLKAGVPYVRQGGSSILDRKEAALFAGIIDLVCGRSKKSGVDNLLSWAGLSEDTLRQLHAQFGENIIGMNPKLLSQTDMLDLEKNTFNTFNKRVVDWKAMSTRSPLAVIEGVRVWMSEHSTSDYEVKIVDAFASILNAIKDEPLEKRLDVIRDRKSKKEAAEGEVTLITCHSSKGLEWDVVWVVAVDDETLPDKKSGIEEERRLMYVAMTRARTRLIVSSSKRPSQFIDEAGLYEHQV